MPTPTDSSLRTGWVAIATEGQSVDGREISAKWITDMAETYDPTFYCAQLWPDHMKWGDNLGYVQALKADQVDGKHTLFAILCPTRDLIYQNQRGQLKFCSIEPLDNFTGQGKTYLFGLGVTDVPASTGTTMLKFSGKHDKPVIGLSQALDLSGFALPADAQPTPDRIGLLDKFFNLLGCHGEAPTPAKEAPHITPDEGSDDMKDEQFNALNDTLKGLGTTLASFSTKLDALGQDKGNPDPAPIPDPKPNEGDDGTGDRAQFNALNDTLKGMGAKLEALDAKIAAFSLEKPDQRPDPLGGRDASPTVC